MDKYINELLDTNTRVIIPDFGAFIIKQKEPRLIVFNEFLRYNDGLLIEYVAKSEKIEKDAAKKKVKEYVDLAGNNLKENEEHLISGLGKLKKESTGKITFEDASDAGKKESKKKEPPKAAKVKEEKKATAEDTKKIPADKDAKAKEAPKVVPTIEQKAKEEKKAPQEKPVEAKASTPESKVQEKKEVLGRPKAEPLIRPADHVKKVETRQKKRSNTQIVVWIILILIINAAIISWFVFNDEIRGFLNKDSGDVITTEEETTGQPAGEESASEEPPVPGAEITEEAGADVQQQKISEPATAPEIEEESISLSEKRYYIVAGCFREENNADALVTKLTQKGYDAEKFGKIGNLHAVSYASFIDRAEAQRKLRDIRNEEAPEAWIVYY